MTPLSLPPACLAGRVWGGGVRVDPLRSMSAALRQRRGDGRRAGSPDPHARRRRRWLPAVGVQLPTARSDRSDRPLRPTGRAAGLQTRPLAQAFARPPARPPAHTHPQLLAHAHPRPPPRTRGVYI